MKTLQQYFLAVFAAGTTMIFATSANASLVSNGGFETGDFTDWTLSGNLGTSGVALWVEHSGNYGAYFGAAGSQTFLTQTLATTAGASYDLSFWLENDGGSANLFTVNWNGNVIDTLANANTFGWTTFSLKVTATSASTPLVFGFQQDTTYLHFDDVSVEQVAAPEVSTCLAGVLMLLPFGASSLRMLRRKQTA
jgi:hypothetical protein